MVAAVVSVVVVGELAMRRRLRLARATAEQRDQTHHAFGVLLAARSRFTHAVAAYEEAVQASELRTSAVVGAPMGPGGEIATPSPTLVDAERAKDRARDELLDAQRLWAASREIDVDQADPDPALWTGRGVLVAGNLGPIGWERATIRLTHLLDDRCWVVVRISRPRLGLAIGAEWQRLAIAGAGVDSDGLKSLLGVAFAGTEVAVRPGFTPARSWRRFRRTEPTRTSLKHQLREARLAAVLEPRSAELSDTLRHTFEAEFGQTLTSSTELGLDRGLLGIHTAGPSLVVGAWGGPKPKVTVELSSDHRGWNATA